jgi:hypothetical protein
MRVSGAGFAARGGRLAFGFVFMSVGGVGKTYGDSQRADTRSLQFSGQILTGGDGREMANGTQNSTKFGRRSPPLFSIFSREIVGRHLPAWFPHSMYPDTSSNAADVVDLSRVVGGMDSELRCLLGPAIEFAAGSLPAGGPALVRADRQELVDLLRHLALDAHDSMPGGGRVTIRTGLLREVSECAAMVIHEVPDAPPRELENGDMRIRKGRSLGLSASYDAVERAGGHFHVSCRGGETVLTICFPLAA